MRMLAIIGKELAHIRRDGRTLFLVLCMPLIMIFLYGYAINLDLRDIPIAVVNLDNSSESRELLRRFSESSHFTVKYYFKNPAEYEAHFRSGTIRGGITIPPDFGKSIRRDFSTPVQIVVDGSDGNSAQTTLNYARAILGEYSQTLLPAGFKIPVAVLPRFWFNPEMKSVDFIIPGLAAVILMMVSALMTSISIAREKETGTLEQLLVTPVSVVETIAGKVIPYIGLALADGLLVIGTGVFVFGAPFVGSPLVLLMNTCVYLYAALALGLLISTAASNQQTAMTTALMTTMLPSIMLSGFIFPVASMPLPLQVLSKLIPATYYLNIIRGVLMKGTGMSVLWPNTLILFVMGTALLALAARKFKVRLG